MRRIFLAFVLLTAGLVSLPVLAVSGPLFAILRAREQRIGYDPELDDDPGKDIDE